MQTSYFLSPIIKLKEYSFLSKMPIYNSIWVRWTTLYYYTISSQRVWRSELCLDAEAIIVSFCWTLRTVYRKDMVANNETKSTLIVVVLMYSWYSKIHSNDGSKMQLALNLYDAHLFASRKTLSGKFLVLQCSCESLW